MAAIQLGIQLYTLRDLCTTAEAFDATLSALQKMGVGVIQISGIGPIAPETVAETVQKYNMDVCVTHTDFNRMKTDLDAMIDEHQMLNCDCMGIGSMPGEARENLDTLRAFIRTATEIGKKMRARGERFCYHNHDFEFRKIDGARTIMDVLLEETDPDLFWFVPDVAWMQIAGVEPAPFLDKMAGRVKVLHFKDYILPRGKRKFCSLGDGLVDLGACYRACQRLEIPYIVYEQDCDWDNNDPLLSAERSYRHMLRIEAENN